MARTKGYDRGMGWPRGILDSMEDTCICHGVSPLLATDPAVVSSGWVFPNRKKLQVSRELVRQED
ncbi:hypothetical protein BDR05DRAFT_960653 [Suillus weaverae]|nr:hypothetical protein BDR05DRAFT_960653 [Suillus weaverae]